MSTALKTSPPTQSAPSTGEQTTDFGYQTVKTTEKAQKVAQVFSSVAEHYDVMNDLMSLGVHRLWKKIALTLLQADASHRILDCAGGSGDLTLSLAKRLRAPGQVTLADINADMLAQGRDRVCDAGLASKVDCIQADAQYLPFADNYFDRITMAFGLRNVTDKAKALRELARVCVPGGRCLILEFSKPVFESLNTLYDYYSFSVLPWLGEKIANDRPAYQYLAESIRKHPPQAVLQQMMLDNGFDDCQVHNLTGGIVAVHIGTKY